VHIYVKCKIAVRREQTFRKYKHWLLGKVISVSKFVFIHICAKTDRQQLAVSLNCRFFFCYYQ